MTLLGHLDQGEQEELRASLAIVSVSALIDMANSLMSNPESEDMVRIMLHILSERKAIMSDREHLLTVVLDMKFMIKVGIRVTKEAESYCLLLPTAEILKEAQDSNRDLFWRRAAAALVLDREDVTRGQRAEVQHVLEDLRQLALQKFHVQLDGETTEQLEFMLEGSASEGFALSLASIVLNRPDATEEGKLRARQVIQDVTDDVERQRMRRRPPNFTSQ